MRQPAESSRWAWPRLPKTPVVVATVAVALAFVDGSLAVSTAHHRRAVRPVVPRLGTIIPRRLPPFIAYDYYGQNTAGIFLIRSDGSDAHALVLDVNAAEPSWSPRGTRLLYTTGDITRGCIIWVVNADGSDQRRRVVSVGLPCLLAQPRWSPNGRQILYIDQGATTQSIYIANADGSHIHRVPHTVDARDASFSPDGRYILFDYTQAGPDKGHLYVIRPNGSGLREINSRYAGEDPSWSPDGTRIIYSCRFYRNPPTGHVNTGPSPHAICEISRTHPKPRILYSVPSGNSTGGQTWSADGKTILFSDDAGQIALLSPSGGTPVEITHTGSHSEPDW